MLIFEILSISTHALTWSATCGFEDNLEVVGNFNSRAHVERDMKTYDIDLWRIAISTHALTWSATYIHLYHTSI